MCVKSDKKKDICLSAGVEKTPGLFVVWLRS